MKTNCDVLIIGGGLAGLASAIHLSKKGLEVILIEKSAYPRHKVCGEYISNEILPYLSWLGADVSELRPTTITRFEFTSGNGKTATAKLPLGGFGISRYALDDFLYQKALANNCTVIKDTVTDISFGNDSFTVSTSDQILTAKIVLGAFGKRSNIDQVLARDFISKKSPWLAVKAHYSGKFDHDLVALHNFKGGYCGVSKVEDDSINICYLADYATFKKYKNIEEYQQNVLYKNKHLKAIFENSTLLFEKPLTISQISFDKKQPVENHILMIGDTAGLIHPLCGNGMAMAIHAAKIASELVLEYYNGEITSRQLLEKKYKKEWNTHFGKRVLMGRILAQLLKNKIITNQLVGLLASLPSILPKIIKQTHGKPIAIN
ncbi:NAD(P)/FAD-dependent oxidoreductase [Flavobacterium sp. Fl-77]|uniref:NAD(P)/FAD-dependent oxidoreductase n=1 Tax=Flavobacterium flavipigmentatum TaxID=2893884 RepID=A0AAJ2SBR8_9FLAO|nr:MULTISPECIES: NAD(P)/FAD-dependent oxidoreductase [unclassified Flavobacterium]MDX6182606.1 NAD(P)/FAD-dependent oxidoreductase [Flavobacterium sp. Fl-33]MDX6186214.1 NAD(P)/FAD-dependent oxidoreductase [Flavobacterium sp. Fl-77]UFH38361.1 NAD(P)/FAD-dependent oxidoreductase [Flavobacterium sp. F-70]